MSVELLKKYLPIITFVVVFALVWSLFGSTRGCNEQPITREDLQQLRDSVAMNTAETRQQRKEINQLAKQDTVLMDSIIISKTRQIVYREKFNNPKPVPVAPSQRKSFLLKEFSQP